VTTKPLRVLMVCAPSPRLAGSAPVGTVKLVRAMLDADWTVDILGCRFESNRSVDPFFSTMLDGATLYEEGSLLAKPSTWIPRAVRTGNRLIGRNHYDVIVSMAHLTWTHVVALMLRRGKRLPWVAYFSDPWANHPLTRSSKPRRMLERALERRTLRAADALVFTCANMRDFVLRPYPGRDQIRTKCFAIPYFFDDALYSEAESRTSEAKSANKVVLRHMGAIPYGNYDDGFLRALALLFAERPDLARRLVVEFYGGRRQTTIDLVRELSLSDHVSFYPGVSYPDSLRLMRESDLLLLLGMPPDAFNGLGNATLHLKMADYIGARRPVFVMGGNGSPAAEAFTNTNGVCPDQDPRAIKDALIRFIDQPGLTSSETVRAFSKPSVFPRWIDVCQRAIENASGG
jgi:glycosyltransferase involved in cell wall biosynthesis